MEYNTANILITTVAYAVLRVFEEEVKKEKNKAPEAAAAKEYPPEHGYTLLCYGGGCLGEIAKVEWKRFHKSKNCPTARHKAKVIIGMITKVCQ